MASVVRATTHTGIASGIGKSGNLVRKNRETVLTHSGLLLEHFARLATNVAGTMAAAIGVLGRRKELEVTRAAYGLTREQMAAIQDIEPALASGPDLTVVPDLTQDDMFGARKVVTAQFG